MSASEPSLDTEGAQATSMLDLLAWFVADEARDASERLSAPADAGSVSARIGRPRKPVDVLRARELLAAGASQAQVALKLRVGETTHRRALKGGP